MTWTDDARCTSADPGLFFPAGKGAHDGVWAYRICFACPVIDDCLQAGMSEAHGIYAATTARERRDIRCGRSTVEEVWESNRRQVDLLTATDGPDLQKSVDVRRADDGCSVGVCDRDVRARGWCEPHYRRWRRDGTVHAHVPIRDNGGGMPLTEQRREAS